jgi:DNA-binding LacI/PurR family transcriptional regulator
MSADSGDDPRDEATPGKPDERASPIKAAGADPFWVNPARRARTSRAARRLPTMKDIAAASGVSQSTVSRVLTGAPTAVPINEATRQRVLKTAREMRYRPNPLARALRGSRTMLLGVIVREIMDPFFAGAIEAVSFEARQRGYNVVLGHAHGRTDEALAVTAVLETRHCDAILVLGDTSDQPRLMEELRLAEVHVVGMWQGSGVVQGVHTITVDNAAGMNLLLDHLIGLGHQRIAFLSGGFAEGRLLGDIGERRGAFIDRLAAERIDAPAAYMREAPNTMKGGAEAFDVLMQLPVRPTAIVASTDVLATGALHAAYRAGIAVPDDVSIAGFDDLPLAAFTNPPLTTVRNPTAEMARVGVRVAIDAIDERESPALQVIAPVLVARESSGPPASKGRVKKPAATRPAASR